jgi:hypothetical protein
VFGQFTVHEPASVVAVRGQWRKAKWREHTAGGVNFRPQAAVGQAEFVAAATCRLGHRLLTNGLAMPGSSVPLLGGQLDGVPGTAEEAAGGSAAEQAQQVAPLLKALADPVRLRLMSLVASHQGGEACVCDLTDAFDLSQPTISHHLKVLHEAGLLDREKARRPGLLPGADRGAGQPQPPDRRSGPVTRSPGPPGLLPRDP